MPNSVVPAVIDALVSLARANITTANVLDAFGTTDDPGDYLMVGVDDPDNDEGFAETAESEMTWAGLGAQAMDQRGSIWCVAQAVRGDGDQKGARDGAYTLVSAVENLIRTNPGLGVITAGWCRPGGSERLTQNQIAGAGAVARVAFQVHFQARI